MQSNKHAYAHYISYMKHTCRFLQQAVSVWVNAACSKIYKYPFPWWLSWLWEGLSIVPVCCAVLFHAERLTCDKSHVKAMLCPPCLSERSSEGNRDTASLILIWLFSKETLFVSISISSVDNMQHHFYSQWWSECYRTNVLRFCKRKYWISLWHVIEFSISADPTAWISE